MRGGVTEVSSAIPVGLYNSRPSTRLGLALGTAKEFKSSSGVLGWPISRVGAVFRVICARPAVAQKRAAMIERDFLDSMGASNAARRGEPALIRISNANRGTPPKGYRERTVTAAFHATPANRLIN